MKSSIREILKVVPVALLLLPAACSAGSSAGNDSASTINAEGADATLLSRTAAFSKDSAFNFVKRQTDFGPRVPNTAPHRAAGDWLETQLNLYCDTVITQRFSPTTFDGVKLDARNFMGRINPDASDRILLLAHWDCRPWADEDTDPANHSKPVDGANDGASGVGVLLEIARNLAEAKAEGKFTRGVDILFVDAEDWGEAENDDSWALGAKYFAQNPPVEAYAPKEAILLDMVGGKNPTFCREYFSEQSNPGLNRRLWSAAHELGYGDIFLNCTGGAVTDDHVQMIEAGIPSVDIIEYHPETGFSPTWHTVDDNIGNIDPATLEAVGKTVLAVITE